MKSLVPFSKTPQTDLFKVAAEAYSEGDDSLLLEFKITGPLALLIFPQGDGGEDRQDELWKHTCLEAFLAQDQNKESPYLEINCAPNGSWNAYEFSSYRQGMKTSALIVTLALREAHTDEAFFRLRVLGAPLKGMKWASLNLILEFQDGSHSYWALTHTENKPDFHSKTAFTAAL